MAVQFLAIAKEESREGTSYGTMPTPDLIKEVKVGESGLLKVGYSARFKSSAASAGAAAIFLNANQLKIYTTVPNVQGASTVSTGFRHLSSTGTGLATSTAGEATEGDTTTGLLIAVSASGGLAELWLTPGTYEVSVKFKASSGAITAKERHLWTETP